MNLNGNQVISILLVVLGVFVASTAQLTDLFGASTTHLIVSTSSLLMSIMAGVQGILSGQASQIKAVMAMPGIEPLKVNAQANQTVAQLALDPAQNNIGVLPQALAAVQNTAKNG